MNRDNILSALAAGMGALELIKKIRSLEEVSVSNKPWKDGKAGENQRLRWAKAKSGMNLRREQLDLARFKAKSDEHSDRYAGPALWDTRKKQIKAAGGMESLRRKVNQIEKRNKLE